MLWRVANLAIDYYRAGEFDRAKAALDDRPKRSRVAYPRVPESARARNSFGFLEHASLWITH